MSVCPKCGASVSMYDTGGTPWYACGSKGTFRSGSCVDREPVATQLREAQQRIKRLEEAGNEMHRYITVTRGLLPECTNDWRKAKEDKL